MHADWLSDLMRSAKRVVATKDGLLVYQGNEYSLIFRAGKRKGVGARGAGIGCKPNVFGAPRNATFIGIMSRMKDRYCGQTKQGDWSKIKPCLSREMRQGDMCHKCGRHLPCKISAKCEGFGMHFWHFSSCIWIPVHDATRKILRHSIGFAVRITRSKSGNESPTYPICLVWDRKLRM